jgi:two-component system, NarL family, nitrate/nitrite response regulator NarL
MGDSLDIVLADRQSLFLDVFRTALVSRGHRVLAATTTRCQLLEEVRRLTPALCVVDSTLPDGDGVDAIGEVRAVSPASKVVILTADGREALMRRALAAGARGFVHKSRRLPAVMRVLENVVRGEVCILMATSAQPSGASRSAQLAAFLTPREVECLGLLAAGFDTPEMARRLGVSPATVRSHVQSVLTKLGVRTRLEAATLAIHHGLTRGSDDDSVACGA